MPRREDSLQSNLGPFRLPERTKPLEMRIIPNYIKLYLTSALSLPRSSAAQGSFLVKASKLLSHRQFPSNFLLLAVCHTCLNPQSCHHVLYRGLEVRAEGASQLSDEEVPEIVPEGLSGANGSTGS